MSLDCHPPYSKLTTPRRLTFWIVVILNSELKSKLEPTTYVTVLGKVSHLDWLSRGA